MSVANKHVNHEIVSVIILSYKNIEYLYSCIDSVLCQDYSSIELIISDDGTDNFPSKQVEQYIQSHSQRNIVNSIVSSNATNLGTVRNINKAISMSSGEYIKLLATDDRLYISNAISEYVLFFKKNKHNDIAFSDTVWLYADGSTEVYSNDVMESINDQQSVFIQLCKKNMLVAGASCFRKSFFEKYGLFNERFFLVEDWPMWLYASKNGCNFGYINKPLFQYSFGIGVSAVNTNVNNRYETDIKLCYQLCIFPYIRQMPYFDKMEILDKYYCTYIHRKGLFQELFFFVKKPRFFWFKFKRKLIRK